MTPGKPLPREVEQYVNGVRLLAAPGKIEPFTIEGHVMSYSTAVGEWKFVLQLAKEYELYMTLSFHTMDEAPDRTTKASEMVLYQPGGRTNFDALHFAVIVPFLLALEEGTRREFTLVRGLAQALGMDTLSVESWTPRKAFDALQDMRGRAMSGAVQGVLAGKEVRAEIGEMLRSASGQVEGALAQLISALDVAGRLKAMLATPPATPAASPTAS